MRKNRIVGFLPVFRQNFQKVFMLITFKSKNTAEVTMYKEHIAIVLDLLNKNSERGVITAAESANAIQEIERLIEQDKQQRMQQDELNKNDDEDDEIDEFEKRKKRDIVTLSARLFPILDMLRTANKKQEDILWGV
jgi:regulatory protein YycI of two-component signal transduction system YycFG